MKQFPAAADVIWSEVYHLFIQQTVSAAEKTDEGFKITPDGYWYILLKTKMPACLVQRSLVPLFDNLGFYIS